MDNSEHPFRRLLNNNRGVFWTDTAQTATEDPSYLQLPIPIRTHLFFCWDQKCIIEVSWNEIQFTHLAKWSEMKS